MRERYGSEKQYPQVITSPNYRRQQRIAKRLKKESEQADTVSEQLRKGWGDALMPITLKYHKGAWSYPIHWYSNAPKGSAA